MKKSNTLLGIAVNACTCTQNNAQSGADFIQRGCSFSQSVHACYTYIHICIYNTFLGAKHIHRVLRYLEKHDLVSRWRRVGLEPELTDGDLDTIYM